MYRTRIIFARTSFSVLLIAFCISNIQSLSHILPVSSICGNNSFSAVFLEAPNGDIYAGGAFTTINGNVINKIARWDGATWHSLGGGMNNNVHALAFSPSGELFAGGAFTQAGGVAANYIAKWDGISWQAVGSGTNGFIESIAFNSLGELYVGGQFTEAGGITANYIAKYSNGVWSNLNSGMNDWVHTIAISSSDEIYVGGRFTTVTNSPSTYITRWDGTSWNEVGGSVNRDVKKLAFAPNGDLYVGGGFTTVGSLPAVRIAKWDGSSWSALAGGTNSTVSSIVFDGSRVFIAGSFFEVDGQAIQHVAQWDNGAWSDIGGGTDGYVFGLTFTTSGRLIIGGLFNIAGTTATQNIAQWDGASWTGLCTPCVCSGPVTLTTQSEVNAFCCTGDFFGNLTIGPSTDITDLSPLNGITSVSGVLRIDGNQNLLTLDGLETLTSGNAIVISNNALNDLEGLDNLQTVSNNFALIDNSNLTDISSLSQLSLVGNASLNILNNSSLPNLMGLDNLTSAGAVTIEDNEALVSLDGLQNLSTVDLWVRLINNGLETLNGLQGLSSVGDDLNIEQNNELINLDGLVSLSQVGGDLIIRNNSMLNNVNGLDGISMVENLSVISNASLENLDGFINLQTVNLGLRVQSNSSLQSCCGIFTALNNGPTTVNISGNPGCASPNDILNGCGDQDGDGFTLGQGDCDDTNANIYPGAVEVCNGIDDDCDGIVDEDETPPTAACASTSQIILDFDHLTFDDNQRHFFSSISEEGFTIQQEIPAVHPQDPALVIHGTQIGFFYKGSPAVLMSLSSNPPSYAVVTQDNGGLFTATDISISTMTTSRLPQTVIIEGVKPDNSIVSQSFLSQSATYFEAFEFNSSFEDIIALRWSSTGFQVDDIVISVGQPIEIELDEQGLAQLEPSVVDAGSVDACGPVVLTLSDSDFNCDDVGSNEIFLTATDPSGNSSSCNVTVIVLDKQNPVFTGILPVDISANCSAIPNVPVLNASDNCSVEIDFRQTSNFDGLCSNYSITRTWTAVDPSGNEISHQQLITVTDITAPEFLGELPENLSTSCDEIPTAPELTAIDNCSGAPVFSEINPYVSPSLSISGQLQEIPFTMTLSGVSDSEMAFIESTTDNSLTTFANNFFTPTVALADGVAFNATSGVGDLIITFDEPVINPVIHIANIDVSQWDFSATTTNVVRLSGNDDFGVSNGKIFDVTPNTTGGFESGFGSVLIIGTYSEINVNISKVSVGTDGLIFQISTLDKNLPIEFAEMYNSGNCPGNFSIVRSWTAMDACGNPIELMQEITVLDEISPVVTGCPQDILISTSSEGCTAEVDWIPPFAEDNCGSVSVTSNYIPGDEFPLGVTTVTYEFMDECGNISQCDFSIAVLDQIAPVPDIAQLPDVIGCEVVLTPPTAIDNCDGYLVAVTSDPINYNVLGTYQVGWNFTDAAGNTTVQIQNIFIVDQDAPEIQTLTVPPDPIALGGLHTTTAEFYDLCDKDDHIATWDWGDGNVSAGIVHQGSNSITGTHSYTSAGVYIISLYLEDGSSNNHTLTATTYAVVYDPEEGFVTGGGWIESPPGAYALDQNIVGKANFGFVSKYKNGANIPTGNTSFHLNVANFKFKSTEYDWLVIAGAKAKFKGSGKVNNSGDYGFMITGIDGQVNGGGGIDKFRIKIWDKSSGNSVVYDNKMGADDTGYDTQELEGGSITVHKQNGNNRVGILSSKFVKHEGISLHAYPNPSRNNLSIDLLVENTDLINLLIIDVNGKVVRDLGELQLAAGKHILQWDGLTSAGHLTTPGVYYFVASSGTEKVFEPIIRM